MSSTIVRSSFDLDNPPPLTPEQEEELARLAAMRVEDIDLSDIPKTNFSNAVRFRDTPFYKRLKESAQVPLDPDVLDWLRSKRGSVDGQVNAILREAMLREEG